tara:strand:- start:1268 stop:1411 length:144 start_codon:yes stop_codon:yes gene_type:complete
VAKSDKKALSMKIAKLVREGKPKDQAVAIAYSMKEKGKLGPKGGYKN